VFLLPALGIQFIAVILVLMMAVGGFWIYMRMGQ
jgi:hypothetical protein